VAGRRRWRGAGGKTLIADYKAPRSVELVDALPLSPQGKVLKHELRKPHWEGMDRQVNGQDPGRPSVHGS